ncbi:MAG: aminoglycoside phosphotransferase family protein [Pseudomonadota bacterium]|nr:aminoglycoside phosphotransferase family protein [Pseudomonadota bacterium]
MTDPSAPAQPAMLETTLAADFIPGTNLKGDLAHADWRFLLPRLQVDNVLCVGSPAPGSIVPLSRICQQLFVISGNPQQLKTLSAAAAAKGIGNLRCIHLNPLAPWPFAAASMDLVHFASTAESKRCLQDSTALEELRRVSRPDAMLHLEARGPGAHAGLRARLDALAQSGFGGARRFWTTSSRGEMATAIPLGRKPVSHYFFANVLPGQSFRKRLLSRAGKWLSRAGMIDCLAGQAAVLHRAAGSRQAPRLPDYLDGLLKDAQVNIAEPSFGFSARGRYNSNKVVFFLFSGQAPSPSAVVKLTRAPEFNHRLENEHRILRHLTDHNVIPPAAFPRPLFLTHQGRLAAIGLGAVQGRPFRTRTQADAQCRLAQAVIQRIVRLGSATASHAAGPPAEAAAALRTLARRFLKTYPLPAHHEARLSEQIDAISRCSHGLPTVLHHGDLGTWNILVNDDNGIIIMDWEAAELHGMPLWDLFYFFRTFASWISRARGVVDPQQSFADHFLKPSALGDLLRATVSDYCRGVGLDQALARPLLTLCWMHRALKESTRLTGATLHQGTYIKLFRLTLESGDRLAFA